MKRLLLAVLFASAISLVATAALASPKTGGSGDGGGGEAEPACSCEPDVNDNDAGKCVVNPNIASANDCNNLTNCPGGVGCMAGEICVAAAAVNCEGNNKCVPNCIEEETACDNPAENPSQLNACLNMLPTLGQWGLIALGLLLLTASIATIKRRGLPAPVTGALLVLLSVGFIGVGSTYSEIQSNRTCGETEVAVELANELFRG